MFPPFWCRALSSIPAFPSIRGRVFGLRVILENLADLGIYGFPQSWIFRSHLLSGSSLFVRCWGSSQFKMEALKTLVDTPWAISRCCILLRLSGARDVPGGAEVGDRPLCHCCFFSLLTLDLQLGTHVHAQGKVRRPVHQVS